MTALLLDTHTFVWAITNPDRLGQRGRSLIEDPHNLLLVSAATAWELSTKARLGTFPGAEPLVAEYSSIMKKLRGTDLPVQAAHALRAGGLRWDHRDPFDRMLAAQAMIESVPLISRDGAFAELAGLEVTW